MAAKAREFVYRALSSGISANILDFRLSQKHLLGDVMMMMMETGCRAGVGEGQA